MKNIPYFIELPSGIPVVSGHFGASSGQPRGPQMKPRLLFHHDWDLLSTEEGTATFKLQDQRIFHVTAGREVSGKST